jgi:hypothetical protein
VGAWIELQQPIANPEQRDAQGEQCGQDQHLNAGVPAGALQAADQKAIASAVISIPSRAATKAARVTPSGRPG